MKVALSLKIEKEDEKFKGKEKIPEDTEEVAENTGPVDKGIKLLETKIKIKIILSCANSDERAKLKEILTRAEAASSSANFNTEGFEVEELEKSQLAISVHKENQKNSNQVASHLDGHTIQEAFEKLARLAASNEIQFTVDQASLIQAKDAEMSAANREDFLGIEQLVEAIKNNSCFKLLNKPIVVWDVDNTLSEPGNPSVQNTLHSGIFLFLYMEKFPDLNYRQAQEYVKHYMKTKEILKLVSMLKEDIMELGKRQAVLGGDLLQERFKKLFNLLHSSGVDSYFASFNYEPIIRGFLSKKLFLTLKPGAIKTRVYTGGGNKNELIMEIQQETGSPYEYMLFVDDSKDNIVNARKLGLAVILALPEYPEIYMSALEVAIQSITSSMQSEENQDWPKILIQVAQQANTLMRDQLTEKLSQLTAEEGNRAQQSGEKTESAEREREEENNKILGIIDNLNLVLDTLAGEPIAAKPEQLGHKGVSPTLAGTQTAAKGGISPPKNPDAVLNPGGAKPQVTDQQKSDKKQSNKKASASPRSQLVLNIYKPEELREEKIQKEVTVKVGERGLIEIDFTKSKSNKFSVIKYFVANKIECEKMQKGSKNIVRLQPENYRNFVICDKIDSLIESLNKAEKNRKKPSLVTSVRASLFSSPEYLENKLLEEVKNYAKEGTLTQTGVQKMLAKVNCSQETRKLITQLSESEVAYKSKCKTSPNVAASKRRQKPVVPTTHG